MKPPGSAQRPRYGGPPRRIARTHRASSRIVKRTRSTVTANAMLRSISRLLDDNCRMSYRLIDDKGGHHGGHLEVPVCESSAQRPDDLPPPLEERPGAARGSGAVVLVPAAVRGAQRGARRRPRSAADLPRAHGRLPG